MLYDDGLVFEPLEVIAYTPHILVFIYRVPKSNILEIMHKLVGKEHGVSDICISSGYINRWQFVCIINSCALLDTCG